MAFYGHDMHKCSHLLSNWSRQGPVRGREGGYHVSMIVPSTCTICNLLSVAGWRTSLALCMQQTGSAFRPFPFGMSCAFYCSLFHGTALCCYVTCAVPEWQVRFRERQRRRKTKKIYKVDSVSKSGKRSWQGGKDLASSAAYTPKFCQAMYACWAKSKGE